MLLTRCKSPNVREWVKVRVPATSANLGPGFDCIGVALDIWNEVEVSRAREFCLEIEGEGADSLPRDESNLVVVGLRAAFREAAKEQAKGDDVIDDVIDENLLPALHVKCLNRIPFARGLGSSSAAIVSGLLAGLVLAKHELPAKEVEALFNLACEIEGHPDNVAPAIYGGLQVGVFGNLKSSPSSSPFLRSHCSTLNGTSPSNEPADPPNVPTSKAEAAEGSASRWISCRVPLANGLNCTVFLPEFILETHNSRSVLPPAVPRSDAVFNASRAAMLVMALSTGNLKLLSVAMEDRLHQPYREPLNPHLRHVMDAALEAGAHGACLSGAGPAVLAWTGDACGDLFAQHKTERTDGAVANAMVAAAESVGVNGRIFMTRITDRGGHVVDARPPFFPEHIHYF